MLLPKIGRPMELGKMSSRKKWICAMAPTLLPLARLTGIIASTPTWNLSPTQITPGFDGAGGQRARSRGICHRRLQRCFDQRDEVVDEIRQAEIGHCGFQIGQAVLQRGAPD